MITLTKLREAIPEVCRSPCERDTIRNNRLSHYGLVILDRRRPTMRERSESFLLQKRSENTIILVFAMRKRERCDCMCGSYGMMENIEIFSLFCNRTYLLRVSSHFSSCICQLIRQLARQLFDVLRPCEDYYSRLKLYSSQALVDSVSSATLKKRYLKICEIMFISLK